MKCASFAEITSVPLLLQSLKAARLAYGWTRTVTPMTAKNSKRMKPIRIPMKFDEAVSDLLKVKPPKKKKASKKK